MYLCDTCDEFVRCPTHEVNGKPLCIFCDKPTLTPVSKILNPKFEDNSLEQDILGIGLLDLLDGAIDGNLDLF